MKNILIAVSYLHSNKIAHRDIKPENILISNKNDMNTIIVADFGLATQLDEDNIIITHCGTPGYIDPEIFEK